MAAARKTLRYDGPGHQLRRPDGTIVRRGDTFTASAKEAEELLTAPYLHVAEVSGSRTGGGGAKSKSKRTKTSTANTGTSTSNETSGS